MIYFDYTATTPIDEEVLNTYIKTQKNFFANTTSLHKLGQMSNYMLEKATQEML
jgi:cysteine desulfurase